MKVKHLSVFFLVIILFALCPAVLPAGTETGAGGEQDIASEMLSSLVVYPAETTSPRSTLKSFLFLTKSYYDLIKEKGFTSENVEELKSIENQIKKLFDLRDVPPSFQEDASMEAAVYLREALERVPLPPLNKVPDEDEMAADLEHGITPFYRIPGTLIEIERIDTGPYKGHYQFTHDTLNSAELIFEQSEDYPPRRQEMEGFYEAYFLTPGPAIPLRLIRSLPRWMAYEYAEQTLWQWILLVLTVLCLILAIVAINWMIKVSSKERSTLQRSLFILIRPVSIIVLTLFTIRFLDEQVFLTGEVLHAANFIGHLIILYCSIAITLFLSKVITEVILLSDRFKDNNINHHLIVIGVRLIAIIAAIIILIQGLHQLGFSLATLLAGASVTGLAVALAAQDTLKNIFGSIMLLLDKPFVVGQRIQVKGHDGFVEEIGMRSTRLRTPTGHLISIPNEDVARSDIKTIGHPGYVRRKFNIAVTYDTPPEKVKRAVELIKEILSVPECAPTDVEENAHPNEVINCGDFQPKVFFDEFNSDSLNIVAYYWYNSPAKWWDFVAHAEWINMQILERFNSEGIDFAFPTQTLYLAGDEKRPLDFSAGK